MCTWPCVAMRIPRNVWPSKLGMVTFMNDCHSGGYELINPSSEEEWLSRVGGNGAKVDIRCLVCSFETSVLIRNFHSRKTARCFCTGSVPWNMRESHSHFLNIVSKTEFEPMPEVVDYEQWKQRKVNNHSSVRLRCRKCNVISDKVEINSFVRKRSASCACRHKTQRIVFEFVRSIVQCPSSVVNEHVMGTWESGRPMCSDIAIVVGGTTLLCIEVDGDQHFRRHTGFPIDFDALQTRDFLKELKCVEQNIPMVRVVQEDVWESKFDWKSFLKHLVTNAIDQQLAVKVHRQCSSVYSSSSYVSIRVGSVVAI